MQICQAISSRRTEIATLQSNLRALEEIADIEETDLNGNTTSRIPQDSRTGNTFIETEREKILNSVSTKVAGLIRSTQEKAYHA